ncbi:MAG: bifunctional hydroxymethylpyrimidine kinase/phosphomethylpyrimidine kinase [Rhizobiales bacterium]|nr:bifunctional hydroxymethylpyrimidine kinase/phosphomethylpyrimidine kinase [Hyphomicrobiales bacterium]
MIPVAMTIAGSDSGGGAGIQADLKTFSALGVFGTSAVTALTAQNTMGVQAVHAPPAEFVGQQIRSVLDDLPVRAIKSGMLFSSGIAASVADALDEKPEIPLVLDPVMVATSGDALIQQDAVAMIIRRLFPRAVLLTPNLAEAAFLTGLLPARDHMEMEAQGRALLARGARAVLIKGGHAAGEEAIDLLVTPSSVKLFAAPRIKTENTHGTGCTLAAAIAAMLARGAALEVAIGEAKRYLTEAIRAGAGWRLGRGAGPVHHFHALWSKEDVG